MAAVAVVVDAVVVVVSAARASDAVSTKPASGPAPTAPSAAGLPSGTGAGAEGVVVEGSSAPPSCFSTQATNACNSLSDTSCMTPRPNCAGLPVTARSVTTSALVPSPSGDREMVTLAPAVPLPRLSLPLASMTARWAASSRSTNDPLPE